MDHANHGNQLQYSAHQSLTLTDECINLTNKRLGYMPLYTCKPEYSSKTGVHTLVRLLTMFDDTQTDVLL